MMRRLQKVLYGLLILLLMVTDLAPAAQAASQEGVGATASDAYSLMLAAHTLLGDDLQALSAGAQPGLKVLASHEKAETSPSPLEVRLNEVKALCAESRQSIQSRYEGSQLCERLAINDQVCTREIKNLETAIARSSRGRGFQSFIRRVLRRVDPGRANLGKLLHFIQHEVLPEAAQQVVGGVLGGGDVVVRRVIRQTFIRKARQVLRTNLTTDLLMSGVQPQMIQDMGLPAPQAVDLSKITLNNAIDLEAIRRDCQQGDQAQTTPSETPTQPEEIAPDMIEQYMNKNAIVMSCKMPSHYYGTSFVDEGAPEWFELVLTLDLKEGEVSYTYDYEANWVSFGHYENRHHGEGKGDYTGGGWFSGEEQYQVLWYNYYLNTATGEHISSGAEEIKANYPFSGVLFDDLSQAVFCRAYGYTKEQIISVGKQALLNWDTSVCNPCTVEIK